MFRSDWVLYDEILYLSDKDTVIISDIHFGASKDLKETKYRLLNPLKKINPNRLVFNGDLYHLRFSQNYETNSYYNYIYQAISEINDVVNELIFLEGNHELHLDYRSKKTIDDLCYRACEKYYKIDDIIITHGHTDINESAEEYIIGHVHPRKNGDDVYHYKENEYNNSNLTIMPAFANSVDGVDIDNYSGRCPFLGSNTETYQYLTSKNQ